jgi:hypothetical protein
MNKKKSRNKSTVLAGYRDLRVSADSASRRVSKNRIPKLKIFFLFLEIIIIFYFKNYIFRKNKYFLIKIFYF